MPLLQANRPAFAIPGPSTNRCRIIPRSDTFEPRERLEYRRTVLRRFRCPFQENGACKNEATPHRCFFGHPDVNQNGPSLRDVPSYVCMYHLVNKCTNRNKQQIEQTSTAFPRARLAKCGIGLHLRPEDMANLEDFEVKNASEICKFFGRDNGRDCGICLEEVLTKRSKDRRFGILERCIHSFCATCILEWRAKDPANAHSGSRGPFTCPICRVPSERIVIHRRFEKRTEQKAKLFAEAAATEGLADRLQLLRF